MPNATVNGISIDYSVTGDGPPVLVICGTGQPADLWFAQVADLAAAGHTLLRITFDNRGCGRSEAPLAPYLVADMAADTAALIEHLGLGPCDIIGYSLGSYIAQERWVAGCTAAGSVMLIGAGVALAYADRHLVPASSTGWTVSNLSEQVVNAAVLVVGLVVASRRPENRIGWLFLAAGLALGLSGFSNRYALHALVVDPGSWPAGRAAAWLFNVIWVIPPAVLAFVLLLFPTGHVRSRRWRLAAWFIGVVFTLATVWALIAATSQWARPFTSPFSQPGSPAGSPALYLMTAFLISAALLVSVAAVVVRFAKSSGEERLQLKWCATAALVLVVVFVASIWDADQMVAAFAARLKDAVDLDGVQTDLAGAVQRALEPAHVSLWLNHRG